MKLSAYLRQTYLHRTRMRLFWPLCCDYFDAASREAIYTALCWHDAEKNLWWPLLFIFHGGRGNRKIARLVYDGLNFTGRLISWLVMRKYSQVQRAEAKRVERILDCLDRSLDPQARYELGDWADPPPLSRFLSGRDLEDAETLKPRVEWLVKLTRKEMIV